MDYHDIDTRDTYYRTLCIGHHADTFFAVSNIPGGQTDTEVYSVFGEGIAGGNFRYAGGILPEKRNNIYGKPRTPGVDIHCIGGGTSFMET